MTLLLDRGATIDAAEARKGQTALMWAAAEGHSAVEGTARPRRERRRRTSKTGYCALAFAATRNDTRVVKSLIAASAGQATEIAGRLVRP